MTVSMEMVHMLFLKKDINSASLMLDKDKNFGVSLVLDFRIW